MWQQRSRRRENSSTGLLSRIGNTGSALIRVSVSIFTPLVQKRRSHDFFLMTACSRHSVCGVCTRRLCFLATSNSLRILCCCCCCCCMRWITSLSWCGQLLFFSHGPPSSTQNHLHASSTYQPAPHLHIPPPPPRHHNHSSSSPRQRCLAHAVCPPSPCSSPVKAFSLCLSLCLSLCRPWGWRVHCADQTHRRTNTPPLCFHFYVSRDFTSLVV